MLKLEPTLPLTALLLIIDTEQYGAPFSDLQRPGILPALELYDFLEFRFDNGINQIEV